MFLLIALYVELQEVTRQFQDGLGIRRSVQLSYRSAPKTDGIQAMFIQYSPGFVNGGFQQKNPQK
jgi:hypothetical protein